MFVCYGPASMRETACKPCLGAATSAAINHPTASCPIKPHRIRRLSGLLLAGVIGFFASPTRAENEIQIGRSPTGQLKVQVSFVQPLGLEVSTIPGFPGFATGDVGFHSVAADDASEDFLELSPLADLRFILLAKDAGMEVWNDTGSAPMRVGESFYIGPAFFDTHPIWDIVSGIPGQAYSLTLGIHDVNGIHADSEPLVLQFTPTPPVLTITATAPGFATISWSPATPGFVLQSSPALQTGPWTDAPTGGTNGVTVALSAPAQFYRLRR